MDAGVRNLLNWVLVWSLVVVGVSILINWLTQGFFLKYLRVKGSRGKKVLVEIETLTDRYLSIGYISEGFLIYKKRNSKDKARIVMPLGSVIKKLGVFFVNVDEEKNAVMKADYTVVTGFDAEKVEMLYKRALYRPTPLDNKLVIILIIVLVLALLAVIDTVMLAQIAKAVKGLVPPNVIK